MNGSGLDDVNILSVAVFLGSPKIVLTPPSISSTLVQLSSDGFNIILPSRITTSYGFTFSVLLACGLPISDFASEYFKVIKSPVFWTFESNSSKFWEKSAEFISILSDTPSNGLILYWSIGTSNSLVSVSTLTFASSLSKSIRLVS